MVKINQKGFTLVEVLVVLALTVLLSGLGYSALKSIVKIDEQSNRLQVEYENLFSIQRTLSLLQNTHSSTASSFIKGDPEGLSFIATLDHNLVGNSLLALELRQAKDPDGQYQLTLSYEVDKEKQNVALANSTTPWRFEYADKQGWKTEWKQTPLPQKIRLINAKYPDFIRRLAYAK